MSIFDQFYVRRIHHLTKYPSIDNYHSMDELMVQFGDDEPVFIYEKIDGTNVRIVLDFADDGTLKDFFVGSRYNILYARGDRNFIDELSIVQDIRSKFPRLFSFDIPPIAGSGGLTVIYGELFGGNVGKFARQYSSSESITGFRVFDVAMIALPDMEAPFDPQQIGEYRDSNLRFLRQDSLFLIGMAELAPYIGAVVGSQLPKCPVETKSWLEQISPQTKCDLGGGLGRSEGVVIRNADRTKIAKVRFENYRKVGL